MQIAPVDAVHQLGGLIEVVRRLATATLLGAIIGTNRELHDKPAGMRTHALVALGAALLTIAGVFLQPASGVSDGASVSRVIQGIITGVGFIGGGVILRNEQQMIVHGLTTAASVWVAACVGIVCGLGHWATALVALALVLLVLVGGSMLETFLRRRTGHEEK